MDPIWTGMIIFYSLLFTAALLLFTCLCILCKKRKRKQRRTRDVNQIVVNGNNTRNRPSLANLCNSDTDSVGSSEDGGPPRSSQNTLQITIGRPTSFPPVPPVRSLASSPNRPSAPNLDLFPPDYEEALKSKYAKVYHIYENSGMMSRRCSAPAAFLSSPSSSGCSSLSLSEEVLGSRPNSVAESPPPPYEMAVSIRSIDSSGHL
ncbi:hypothetical protein RvY_07224 [Ramazzottius varieornatus]|uniref:Uncharacterized protein n=1 Tax=Ramazzottius varieornatus TaxID=947166 RepID=A0A1D1VAT7_RAMVA|nr:hypothetical protein RvY_07224 [Ramazzottius varieornatus]